MNVRFEVVRIDEQFRKQVDCLVVENWAVSHVVTRGVLHDTRTHPGFVAIANGKIVGYVLYHISNSDCEITVLESMNEGQGIGKALVNAVVESSKNAECRRIWLITTNDNTHAIRFYQKIGFILKNVHINAIDEARKLKPQIPLTGCDGIPIAHEFEFEMMIDT